MIYDGTSAHKNGESSTDRYYGTSKFNSAIDNKMYVGYMYTEGETHDTGTSSTIKIANDKFYADKLSSYASKLDTDAGFCGDRSILIYDAAYNDTTYYNSYYRYTRNTPSLMCINTEDFYTSSNSSIGNKALKYPIGLTTMDEYMYAGFSNIAYIANNANNQKYVKSNANSYLSIETESWTMTPAGYFNPAAWKKNYAMVFSAYNNLWIIDPVYDYALRPVINLKSDVVITGTGTMTDPYVIKLISGQFSLNSNNH